jgi:hypothetical protein
MRQRAAEIPGRARDPRREQLCGGVVRPFRQADLDVLAGGFKLALGKQHGGQKMMQHGIAGPADQSLFAQLARRIRLAGIKGRRSAANDVLGVALVHARHIRATTRACKEGQSRVFVKRPGTIPAFAFPPPSSSANGSAVWPPDDRLQRTIQYAARSRFYR